MVAPGHHHVPPASESAWHSMDHRKVDVKQSTFLQGSRALPARCVSPETISNKCRWAEKQLHNAVCNTNYLVLEKAVVIYVNIKLEGRRGTYQQQTIDRDVGTFFDGNSE